MRLFWFYQFHTLSDFIKGTILFLVLNIVMIPFDIWAVQLIILGPSYTFFVVVIGILGINFGYYIKAIICWRINVCKAKKLAKEGRMPEINPNVDIIWQIKDYR